MRERGTASYRAGNDGTGWFKWGVVHLTTRRLPQSLNDACGYFGYSWGHRRNNCRPGDEAKRGSHAKAKNASVPNIFVYSKFIDYVSAREGSMTLIYR